jgi:hypothetical protein
VEEVKGGGDDVGVEFRPGPDREFAAGVVRKHRLDLRRCGNEIDKGSGDADDPRCQRNLVTVQSIGVTLAIVPFVMRPDNWTEMTQLRNFAQKRFARNRVLLEAVLMRDLDHAQIV